ncbi:nitrilase family protein [Candidatus Formimonas warabiya]|uniref:Nitrilase n=1 Tax=Formimonas warabiya TaxID=1761012 RepID=A0A3G1KY82_FORW1|nr:nitrilase family protein [Candidatus Formimonas warabiya]ATW27370.1 nitrilase [Candidatus Formimonas warabiya]
MKETRIGLVQMQAEIGQVKENLAKITWFIEAAAAKEVDVLCFPELSITGYTKNTGSLAPETIPGPSADLISALAQKTKMVILAGLPEKSPTDKPYITQLVAFPNGLVGTYRKTHLGKSEWGSFSPGDELPVFMTEKVQFGMGICWDMHFPEVSTVLALQGSEIIFAPHASPQVVGNRREIWLKYLPARAYDNGVFLAACNLIGKAGEEKEFCGGALVLDPRGNIVAEAFPGKEDLLIADLDPGLVNQMRTRERKVMRDSFFLQFRRPELYRQLAEDQEAGKTGDGK